MCSSSRGDDSEPGGANSGEKAKCDEPKEKTFHDAAVEFNAVIGKYPIPSFVTYVGMNYGIFGVSTLVLKLAGFDAPTLAAAVVIARTVKRLRLPVDITVAAGLAKAYPLLSEVKMGSLFMVQMDPPKGTAPNQAEEKVGRWSQRMQDFVMGPIDKYGAAMILSHTVMGLGTVATLHAMLSLGTDISGWIAWLGLSDTMSEAFSTTASAMAGAACINSMSLPIKLALFPELVPYVAGLMGMKPAASPTVHRISRDDAIATKTPEDPVISIVAPATPIEQMQEMMKNNWEQQRRYHFRGS